MITLIHILLIKSVFLKLGFRSYNHLKSMKIQGAELSLILKDQ